MYSCLPSIFKLFILSFLPIILVGQNIPSNMTLESQWDPSGLPSTSGVTYNDIWGWDDGNGNEYAIVGNSEFIFVIDVTIPSAPVQIYQFDAGQREIWRDFKTFKNYFYGVCDSCSEGLHIFDMSALPGGNVQHVNTTTQFFTASHNIYIDEANERLYAVGVAGSGSQDMVVLDLSVDPANPTMLANVNFGLYVHDVFVKDNIAYCSHGFSGMTIYDMTDPVNFIAMGNYDVGNGYNHSSWITDDERFSIFAEEVPDGKPLRTLNITNLNTPFSETTFQDRLLSVNSYPTPHNPFIKDDLLIISYYEDGIKVYDVRDPANPVPFAHYDTHANSNYSGTNGCWGAYPFLPSGVILGLDIANGLHVLTLDTELDCDQVDLHYSGMIPNFTDSRVGNDITADGLIGTSHWIEMQAQNSIELQNGFEIDTNSDVHLRIGPCETVGPILPQNQNSRE